MNTSNGTNSNPSHAPATPAATPGSRATRHVYTITERPNSNDRSFWTRVGAAWTNRDGSLTIRLDALPVNGVLQVRDADEHRANGSNP